MMNIQTEHRHASTGPTPYDEVYYPGHVYGLTHPNHLATIAAVYGMQAAPVERCRVLELGCGVGGNLLPMAFQHPNSTFVGVDLSRVTIERGQQNIATLGLCNIKLLHCNIMNVDASFGQFDYIIAHGVYSWVPPTVREKMMMIFKQNLAPRGVCYVSYNAHPFSHLRDMVRDMMRYHTRRLTDMKEKVGQARAILKFLSDGSKANSVHGAVMRDQYNRVLKSPDELLFHDDLDDGADPCEALVNELPPGDALHLSLRAFDNATHAFDGFDGPSEVQDSLAHRGRGGVMRIRPNPEAREAARADMVQFFAGALKPK